MSCKYDCGRLAKPQNRACGACAKRRSLARCKKLPPLTGTPRQIDEQRCERIGDSMREFYRDNPDYRARLSRLMRERIQAGFRCGNSRKVDAEKLASMRAQRATGATMAQVARCHGICETTCFVYLKGTSTSKYGPRPDVSASRVLSLRRRGLSISRIAYVCKCSSPTILNRLSRGGP